MIATIAGFLGTRASLMLDVVFLAMFAVLPVLGYSVYLVKYQRRFALHKKIQLVLGAVLLVTVTLFEVDMRINGWKTLAKDSPYYGDGWTGVWISLYIHLFFAISTTFLWIWVIVAAVRKFPKPPAPGEHSRQHIVLARLATFDMVATAVTGWIFYWLAFVASK
jgi:putative membrane protein